jgi:hypothetical protein
VRWLPLVLLLSSCNLLYDGRCIGRDKSRDITLSTSLPANNTYFQVTAVEHEREEPRESISWVSQGGTLSGHVLSMALHHADGRLLVTLPVGSQLQGAITPYAGAVSFQVLFEAMQRGDVRLRVATDLPGQEQLEQALEIAHFNDWDYPNCS